MAIDAITIIHAISCLTGLSLSSYVLLFIVIQQGEEWHIPLIFISGGSIIAVNWFLGFHWNFDTATYPQGFCNTSAVLFNFGAFCMTTCGVCLSLTTWNAIHQARQGRFAAICRPWQIPSWLKIFFFAYPVIAVIIFATLGLHFNAFGPEGMWICDVDKPDKMWIRAFGYGGVDVLVTIPAFLASFASVRNLYLIHNDARITKDLKTFQQANYGIDGDGTDEGRSTGGFDTQQFKGRPLRPDETIQISLEPAMGSPGPESHLDIARSLPSYSPMSSFQMSGVASPTTSFTSREPQHNNTWNEVYDKEFQHEDARYQQDRRARSSSLSKSYLSRGPSGRTRRSADNAFSETDSMTEPAYPMANDGNRGLGLYTPSAYPVSSAASPWEQQHGADMEKAYFDRAADYSRRLADLDMEASNTGNAGNKSPMPLTTMVWQTRLEAERRQAERQQTRPTTAEDTSAWVHSNAYSSPGSETLRGTEFTSINGATLTANSTPAVGFKDAKGPPAPKPKKVKSKNKGSIRSSPKLLHALWRIMFFDVVFTFIEVLAAITSWRAIAIKQAPTGYSTAFVAVELGIWGPFIIFGSTPIILDHMLGDLWRRVLRKFGFDV